MQQLRIHLHFKRRIQCTAFRVIDTNFIIPFQQNCALRNAIIAIMEALHPVMCLIDCLDCNQFALYDIIFVSMVTVLQSI